MALIPFSGQLIADTGISMGDEGKGRVIPEVVRELQHQYNRRDIVGAVLKVNGGANSGHTVGGLKLNLLPGGVIEHDVEALVLGAGVVADPHKIHWEAKPLEKLGYKIYDRLLIDERTMMSDVTHRMLDLAWEHYRVNVLGQLPRGSTGRGITPAYADEVGQWQIYFADFLGSPDDFAEKMCARMDRAERMIQHVCRVSPEIWNEFLEKLSVAEMRANAGAVDAGTFPPSEFDFKRFGTGTPFRFNHVTVIKSYWDAGFALRKNIVAVRDRILSFLAEGRYIIGEFGQSYWLDKRQGFSPNVTASHTFTPEIFQSAGIPVQPAHTIGCCKAYDTKVGTHTFLTQMDDEHPLTIHLKKLEYGSTTGRQRMVGWCDCVEKADALRYGGFQDMVINKLDALSPCGDWKGGDLQVCVGYQDAGGKIYDRVPRNDAVRRTLKPVYVSLPGWTEDISGIRNFAKLPVNAQRYVAFIVSHTCKLAAIGTNAAMPNVRYIGIGPDPEQIIKDVPATPELMKLAECYFS